MDNAWARQLLLVGIGFLTACNTHVPAAHNPPPSPPVTDQTSWSDEIPLDDSTASGGEEPGAPSPRSDDQTSWSDETNLDDSTASGGEEPGAPSPRSDDSNPGDDAARAAQLAMLGTRGARSDSSVSSVFTGSIDGATLDVLLEEASPNKPEGLELQGGLADHTGAPTLLQKAARAHYDTCAVWNRPDRPSTVFVVKPTGQVGMVTVSGAANDTESDCIKAAFSTSRFPQSPTPSRVSYRP